MRCPHCNANDDKVIDSRSSSEGRVIRRRRECLECHKRFTTYESTEGLVSAGVAGRPDLRLRIGAHIPEHVDADEVALELYTLIRELNALHIENGGSGLVVDDWGVYSRAAAPVEAR